MQNKIKMLFRTQTDTSTFIAASTVLIMWLLYYVGSHASGAVEQVIFVGGIMLALSTVFIGWFVKKHEHGTLAVLGIYRSRIKTAIALSSFFGLGSVFYFFQLADEQNISTASAMVHLLWSLLMLWEVVFVFGWLQIRFDRAFGAILGIVLAASAFTLYHVGSVPTQQLAALAVTGVFFAILFRAVRMNIFALWPFAWGVGSAIGTLQISDSHVATPSDAVTVAAVVVAQALIFWYIFRNKEKAT